jgi:hypothetical protein
MNTILFSVVFILNVSCAVVFVPDASRDGITSSEHHDPSYTLQGFASFIAAV